MKNSEVRILIFILVLAFVTTSFAQVGDAGRAPSEEFKAGAQQAGIFSVYDPLYCSQSAKRAHLPQLTEGDVNGLPAAQQIRLINGILSRAYNILALVGDRSLRSRHVCTGFYNDVSAENGNAKSMTLGYMIFDFRLIRHVYDLPEKMRSNWALDFIALHEFAHQLQFWNNDEVTLKALKGEASARKSELGADCVAASLLTMMNTELSRDLFTISFQGVLGTASALGDYGVHLPGHHGTPYERQQAAEFGSQYVAFWYLTHQRSLYGLKSADLLRVCYKRVDQL